MNSKNPLRFQNIFKRYIRLVLSCLRIKISKNLFSLLISPTCSHWLSFPLKVPAYRMWMEHYKFYSFLAQMSRIACRNLNESGRNSSTITWCFKAAHITLLLSWNQKSGMPPWWSRRNQWKMNKNPPYHRITESQNGGGWKGPPWVI